MFCVVLERAASVCVREDGEPISMLNEPRHNVTKLVSVKRELASSPRMRPYGPIMHAPDRDRKARARSLAQRLRLRAMRRIHHSPARQNREPPLN
jgi:hypothetical protein